MKETKKFEMFGVTYETTQFSAVEALSMIDSIRYLRPSLSLANTRAIKGQRRAALSNEDNINRFVKDSIDHLPASTVLAGLIDVVIEFNYGFLKNWEGVKIPQRFLADSQGLQSNNIEPMIASLINSEKASLKELQEYYSLKDAFVMFDAVASKSLTDALAQEQAMRDSKR